MEDEVAFDALMERQAQAFVAVGTTLLPVLPPDAELEDGDSGAKEGEAQEGERGATVGRPSDAHPEFHGEGPQGEPGEGVEDEDGYAPGDPPPGSRGA